MDPLTVSITPRKRLDYFKRILVFCLCGVTVIGIAAYFFQARILQFVLPYLPLDEGKSVAYYEDMYRVFLTELVWLILIGLLSLALPHAYHQQSLGARVNAWMITNHWKFLFLLTIIFAAGASVISMTTLREFPNSSDEYVYLYQAETLSEGRMWYPASPVEDAFSFNHIAEKDGRRVGRFPPGWPLLMAIFLFGGIPAGLVNVILGILALYIFYRLAFKLYGAEVANWSSVVLVSSSFFVFNAASYFSHTSCLFEALVFMYCIYLFLDKNQIIFGLMAGAALGLMLITRYYTAVLIAVPYCVYLFYKYRLRSFWLFLWIALGALPFFIYLLFYNYNVTGNPLEPVTVWAYEGEGLGFVNGHTFVKGVEHILRRVFMFFYWASPVLLIIYLVLLYRKLASNTERHLVFEDYFFLFLIFGYLLYYEIGGNQYGPRFYFEAFPFLILFVIRETIRQKIAWSRSLLIAGVIIMLIRLPLIAHREGKIVEERMDIYTRVEEANVRKAIILVADGTGVIRPMPSGDLTRNDKEYNSDVLYAVDRPSSNGELMRRFPDRQFYRYSRNPGNPVGKLTRIK